jgi:N4-gp56 family major capsid protein
MAASANATMLAQLIDPQVLADYIDQKLIDKIRLAPLATIDRTLEGRDGDELTLPAYSPFIGTAPLVGEGQDIPIAKLGTTTKRVKVTKIGKGVEITDEALLSGYQNNAADEATREILLAINDGVERRLLDAMDGVSSLTHTISAATNASDGIADALTQFGEDIDGEKVLLINPSFYARLRKSNLWIPNTEIGANILIRGTVGMVHGCQVALTNRLTAPTHYAKTSDVAINSSKTYYTFDAVTNVYTAVEEPAVADLGKYYEKSTGNADTAYIVKPGALRIYMKRDTLVEVDRDIISQTNFIVGSKLFAPYVYDESKIIKITLGS